MELKEHAHPETPNLGLAANEPTLTELQNIPSIIETPSEPRDLLHETVETPDNIDTPNVQGADHIDVLRLLHLETQSIRVLEHPELEEIKDGEVLLPFGFVPNSMSKTSHAFKMSAFIEGQRQYERYRPLLVPVDKVALERWTLACLAFNLFPDIWIQFKREKSRSSCNDNPGWIILEYSSKARELSYLSPRIPYLFGKDMMEIGRFPRCVCPPSVRQSETYRKCL